MAPEGGGDGRVRQAHTLVVTGRALWACGFGLYGQLGLNDMQDGRGPGRVGAGGVRVVAAAAAFPRRRCWRTLWTWGFGGSGQLGLATMNTV